MIHSNAWSDSLVGADKIDSCEVVVDKTPYVDAAQSRRWREQTGEILSFRTFVRNPRFLKRQTISQYCGLSDKDCVLHCVYTADLSTCMEYCDYCNYMIFS